MSHPRRLRLLIIILIVAFGMVPIGLYWAVVGRVSAVTPAEARRMLADPAANCVLVDVRSADEFAAGHVDGAIHWPLAEIQSLQSPNQLPAGVTGRRMLVICAAGGRSAVASAKLNQLIPGSAMNVRGGMQEWTAGGAASACPINVAIPANCTTCRTQLADATPFRAAPLHEQWAAVITGFGVKPIYMLISLIIAWALRRQNAADLAALRWAMIFFFLGEAFCAANYFIYGERSYLFEYLHNFGMVLAFGFTVYSLLEGIDVRLVRYSELKDRCAAIDLCRRCIKYDNNPCGLRRVFLVAIPAIMILAALPLFSPYRTQAYSTVILGTPYIYMHEIIHQTYEVRILPIMAMLLLSSAFVVLLWRERHPVPISKVLFAAAIGAISFSYFRLVLLTAFADNQVWFATWEELAELLYVLMAGTLLLIFRRGLLMQAKG